MKVEIAIEAAQCLFWELLFQIFDIVSLQCGLLKSRWIWPSLLTKPVQDFYLSFIQIQVGQHKSGQEAH